jgi:hypothetical protein
MSLIKAENDHICWLTDLGDVTMWRCQNCGIQVTAPDRETAETEAQLHRSILAEDGVKRIDTETYYELLGEYQLECVESGWTCNTDCDQCGKDQDNPLSSQLECENWCEDTREMFDNEMFQSFTGPAIEIADHDEDLEKFNEATKNHKGGFVADDMGMEWGINGLITKI